MTNRYTELPPYSQPFTLLGLRKYALPSSAANGERSVTGQPG
jgi:hypothetical protein